MRQKEMTRVKGTFYGRVHRTAYTLWLGPDYIQNEDEKNPLGGLCVLRLAIRKGSTMKPVIESRAAYTSLDPDNPQDAILRAIYWDSKTVDYSNAYDTPFKIPARFVQMSLTLLLQSIHLLNNLQTSIQTTPKEDDNLPICTLRVETNSVSSLFEKTWQVIGGENDELNRTWQIIWQQMGQALQTSPTITGLEEWFPSQRIEPDIYDLQAYQPSLDLP